MENATQSTPATPTTQTPRNGGMSYETKTIIVVLLFLFITPAGIVLMWLWMKWPTWLKISLTILPFLMTLLTVGFVFFILVMVFSDPQVKKQMKEQSQKQQYVATNISKTPTLTVISNNTDWKTYETSKYSLSYPSDWIINKNPAPQDSIAISEKGKSEENGLYIEFDLYDRWAKPSGNEIYRKQTTWLGQQATLILGTGELNHLILLTKIGNQDYQLTMWGPTKQALEENTDVFLKVADSIKIK